MAGMYLFFGPPDRRRLDAAARRIRFFDEEVAFVAERPFSAVWAGHDDGRYFGPAIHPATGVRIISSGRVSWDEADWARAGKAPSTEGGLSNRLLLERYLEHGAEGVGRHNGPALVVLWDPRVQVLHLWTDHFGYHPAYLYRPEDLNHGVISTFTDAIADDHLVTATRDPTSAAEFLSAWRITPPHTHYREIKYAGAASHATWDFSKGTFHRERYWDPFCEDPFPDLDAAAEELAAAVSNAVRIRTLPHLAPVVAFASGGMDSRAMLFSAASRGEMVGLNLYDVPNHEAAVSRRLCEAAGVRYVGFARDSDYYPRTLPEAARISGGMWSHEDNHYLGAREAVTRLGARTVMTACTTDWLFKGYGLEKAYTRFLGRNLPIKVLTKRRVDAFLPNLRREVPEPFRNDVEIRLEEWFAGTPGRLAEDRDWLAVEDRRIRPACYAVSVSGQLMYRIFPYDTFLADRRVADCYSRSKAIWKVNGDLWGRAARRICVGASNIEDANFGWRVGSSTMEKLAVFGMGWLKRRVKRPTLPAAGLATEGSWPNFTWYAKNSALLRAIWQSVSGPTRDFVRQAWGDDPWRTPLEGWSTRPHDVFRILTLSAHMDRRGGPSGQGQSQGRADAISEDR